MTTRALNESEMVDKLYNAISSGDASAVKDAMEMELEIDVEETDDTSSDEDVTEDTTTDEEPAPAEGGTEGEEKDPPQKSWRDLLPEDLKDQVLSEFDSLAHEASRLDKYYKSNEGRVSGLQKKINLLESQLSSVKTPRPNQEAPKPPAPESVSTDPILEELKESDPALYKALEVMRSKEREDYKKEVEKVRSELNEAIAPIHQREERDYVLQEVAKVKSVVPEVEQVLASPEWRDFVDSANPGLRAMTESKNSDEFLTALEVFALHLQRNAPPATTPTKPTGSAEASRVQESRTRKLSSSTPTSRAPALGQQEELDADELLEKMFQDIRKKQGYKD